MVLGRMERGLGRWGHSWSLLGKLKLSWHEVLVLDIQSQTSRKSFPVPIFGRLIPYAQHRSDPLPQDFMTLPEICSRLQRLKLTPLYPVFPDTYMTEMLKELGM